MTPQDEQTPKPRVVVESLDQEFAHLHERSCNLVVAIPAENLYKSIGGVTSSSVGENVLRSAASVEQTFGGLTANLWDDPFEWTLPETLSTPAKVLEYLEEVEQTRQRAFAAIPSDSELFKKIPLPSEEFQPLAKVLIATLVRAAGYQGRANACMMEWNCLKEA